LEEAKADTTGIYLAKWLVDQKLLPSAELNGIYASYVAGIFRTLRFGTGEAHGRAEMMEFNVLLEHGALAQGPMASTPSTTLRCLRRSRRSLSNCSRSRPMATALGLRRGSPSTTSCRRR